MINTTDRYCSDNDTVDMIGANMTDIYMLLNLIFASLNRDAKIGNPGLEFRIQTGTRRLDGQREVDRGDIQSDQDANIGNASIECGRRISLNTNNMIYDGGGFPSASCDSVFLRAAGRKESTGLKGNRRWRKGQGNLVTYIAVATATAGSLFFGTPKTALAEPGDYITDKHYSPESGRAPKGAEFDNEEDNLYYIESLDNKIYRVSSANNYQAAPGTAVVNLESGDEYFGLGLARISGTLYFAAANVTDCELEIYNGSTGAQINSAVMPGTPGGPGGPKGVTFDGGDWVVFSYQNPISLNFYNPSDLSLTKTTNLNDAGITNVKESEITFDSTRNLWYIIRGPDDGFYIFKIVDDTKVKDVQFFYLNYGPGYNFIGAAFDENNLELLLTDGVSDGWNYIWRFEGYDAPASPLSKIDIFRPSNGLWSEKDVTRFYFGSSGDRPMKADLNGDGEKNSIIFRPSTGLWSGRNLTRFYFGDSTDIQYTGDFNGDGTDETGVFRGSQGLWAIRDLTRKYMGSEGDKPVPADYDGDGTTDMAVFRPSSGLWAVNNVTRFYFGSSDDKPVPHNYSGDSICDAAVFRPSTSLWSVRNVTRAYFGSPTDMPVPEDYNDGSKSDIAVFRESIGKWAIKDISSTYFGQSGDIPVNRPVNQ